MTLGQDLWDMIAIVIALDSLHKDLPWMEWSVVVGFGPEWKEV